MGMIGLGDMAQTFMLRQMSTSVKRDANIAATELTSGRSADISQKLRGELAPLGGIETSLQRLNGYQVATDNAALRTNAMQSVLENIDRLTDGLGTTLLSASTLEGTRTLDALIKDAADRFDAVLGALNSNIGGRTLFAGINSDGPAVASADVILTALEAAITAAGAVNADDITTVVDAWFSAPSGFATTGYLGGNGAAPFALSSDDKINISITAADPAIRNTLKNLATIALAERGNVVSDSRVASNLAQTAGISFLQNDSDRATLRGQLGMVQGRIEQTQTRNTAEQSMLQIARANLITVDPFEAATRMESAQTQLETLYSVTARLSRLSLVDFLR
jgi:flagellar hook-associated protein 3 FlgL